MTSTPSSVVRKKASQSGSKKAEGNDSDFFLLQKAIVNQDLEAMRRILERGIDKYTTNSCSKLLIHKSIIYQNWEALELLLKHKVNPNFRDLSGLTPLHLAVMYRCNDVILLLLKHGADPHLRDTLDRTALHWAVIYFSPEMTRSLLANGADINARDCASRTPLHYSVELANKFLVDVLLAHGADINLVENHGLTPFHVVIDNQLFDYQRGNVNCDYIFDRLVKHEKMDINNRVKSNGLTSLHLAAIRGSASFVKKLLSHGARVDAVDITNHMTPLHYAVEMFDEHTEEKLIDYLLMYGADPLRFNLHGDVSLIYASGDMKLLEIFTGYLIRMRIAGFQVDSAYADFIKKYRMNDRYQIAHSAGLSSEIDMMKNLEILPGTSYYDFIHFSKKRLADFVTKPQVEQIFGGKPMSVIFHAYGDLIEQKYAVGKLYSDSLEPATNCLDLILEHKLPSLPLEQIINYLDYADMKNLVVAFTTPSNEQ